MVAGNKPAPRSTEKDLLFSDELLRSIVDAAPTALLVIDGAGIIRLVNRRVEDLFGRARGDILGKPLEHLVADRLRARFRGFRIAFCQNPQDAAARPGFPILAARKDGSEFPVDIALARIDSAQGRLASVTVRDATSLRHGEKRFHGLLDSSADALIIVDAAGRITNVNERAEALFGYARADLEGLPFEVLVPDPDHQRSVEERDRVLNGEQNRGAFFELGALKSDGSQTTVHLSLARIDGPDGRVLTVTVRHDAEAAPGPRVPTPDPLALAEHVHDAVVSCDAEGRIVGWNRSAERVYGWAGEEARGRKMAEMLKPEHVTESAERAQRLLQIQGRYRGDVRHATKSGAKVLLAGTLVQNRSEDGRVLGTVWFAHPKGADPAGPSANESLLDGVDLALVGFKLDGTIATCNAAAARLLGHEPHALDGRHASDLVAPELWPELDQAMERAFSAETVSALETRLRKKEGDELDAALTMYPSRDAAGAPAGLVVTLRDIIELRRARQSMRLFATATQARITEMRRTGRTADLAEPLKGLADHLALVERYEPSLASQPARDLIAHLQEASRHMANGHDEAKTETGTPTRATRSRASS